MTPEPPNDISKLIFAGTSIVLLMYGVYFTLTIICIHYLLAKRTNNWIVFTYLIASLLATTLFLGASGKYTEIILLELPSGSIDPTTRDLIPKLDLIQQIAITIKIWLADGLLIHRLWIVWFGSSHFVIALPLVLYIGSLASGVTGLALFWHVEKAQQVRHLGVAFHSFSVALNVITTSLIGGRLLYQRRQCKWLAEEESKQYLTLTAVFAESGAIYSLAGLIYIPLYARNSKLVFVFAAFVEAASGIAPALILLRVAVGVAVSRRTRAFVSAIQFNRNAESITRTNAPTILESDWSTRQGEENTVELEEKTKFQPPRLSVSSMQ